MELQESYEDIRAEGAELLAISVDSMDDAQSMAELADAEFPILSDEAEAVTRTYGIFDLLDDGLAAPSTFILEGNSGAIIGGHIGDNPNARVPGPEIIAFIREFRES